MKKLTFLILSLIISISIFSPTFAKDGNKNNLLRQPIGVYDLQRNTVSNVDFYLTNYGIFALNVAQNKGGLYWPKGSQNEYIFGSGAWFGAKKMKPDSSGIKKYVEITYNPNSGTSWMVPGMIEDGDTIIKTKKYDYRSYFSTDFNLYSGVPKDTNDGPNWPIWITDSIGRYQFGTYKSDIIYDVNNRNRTNYPQGPLFVSDEDIVNIYKDTDLSRYDGFMEKRRKDGYPLGLQFQERVFTWGTDELKDVVILSYIIKNTSNDTLKDCYLGGIYDVDLALATNTQGGAGNDRFRYFSEDTTLNLAVGWTNTDQGELGKGFGYIGISLIESPAISSDKFLRTDKYIYETSEQIGLSTFRCNSISEDKNTDDERYDFLSSNLKDNDNGPGDNRMLISSGGFHMRPGDVAHIAFLITFAMPAKGGEADGTYEDLAGFIKSTDKNPNPHALAQKGSLINKINVAKEKYYSSIISKVHESDIKTSNFEFKSVSPNPAQNNFNINYSIGSEGYYKMSIFNSNGTEVIRLIDKKLDNGDYNDNINLNQYNLTQGTYYIRLQHGTETQTCKVVIIK